MTDKSTEIGIPILQFGRTPEPVPKSVCLARQMDREHGLVTNMAGSHAQHTQLKFSSEFEQF